MEVSGRQCVVSSGKRARTERRGVEKSEEGWAGQNEYRESWMTNSEGKEQKLEKK